MGQDTYHPYMDMADADYTDSDVSGITDTITVEQVKVVSYSVADSRVNVNDIVNVDVTLDYASDNTDVIDGSITINGVSATHQGLGVWRITVSQASVTSVTYDTVAASGNVRGITSVDQNGQSQQVIWDKLTIHFSATNTAPVLGETVTVSWTITRQYDSSTVTSFTIQVTRDGASWYSGSASSKTDVENSAVTHTYTASAITDNDEDLTAFDTDSVTVSWTPPSVETSTGTGTAYFESDQGTLTDLSAVDEASLPTEGKPNLVFPHGFFSFKITGLTSGATVTVTITLPSAVPVGTQYWKYHASEGGWIQLPMGSNDGDNVITITLVDGGLGDDDGIANGIINDQGGPGNPRPAPKPVGGEVFPVDKLALLAPYIMAILIIATTGATIIKKRRY